MLIREDLWLLTWWSTIHRRNPSIFSLEPFATKRWKKTEIDLLWKISRFDFLKIPRTNSSLSLFLSLESVSRNRLNREGPLKCSSSSAKVQSRFSRVDSRAYRYILQLMANGKSILIEILAMSFTVSDIILSDRREHDWTGSWLRAY